MSKKEDITKEITNVMGSIFAGLMEDKDKESRNNPLYDFIRDKSEWLGDPETGGIK